MTITPAALGTAAGTGAAVDVSVTASGAGRLVVAIVSQGTLQREGGAPSAVGAGVFAQVESAVAASEESTVELWHSVITAGGAYTVSVPNTLGASVRVCVAEATTTAPTTSVDGSAWSIGASGTPPQDAITTTVDETCLFIACGHSDNQLDAQLVPIAGTSSLYLQDNGEWGSAFGYMSPSSSGENTTGWTDASVGGYWCIVAVAFREDLGTDSWTIEATVTAEMTIDATVTAEMEINATVTRT